MNPLRVSVIWPLFIMLIAASWLAYSLGILNGPAADLLLRAWPALLVFIGLVLLIGRRIRFGNIAALLLSAVLIGGVASVAFGQQSTRVRTDNRKTFTQAIEPQVDTVKLVVNMLNTEVTVASGENPAPTILAEFTGSRDSRLTTDYQIDGTTGTFTLVESQGSGLPSLEGLGRGQLKITLPVGISIKQASVNISLKNGPITFAAAGTALTEANLATTGAITVAALPASLTTLSITTTNTVSFDSALPAALDTFTVNAAIGTIAFDTTNSALRNLTVNAASVDAKLPSKAGLIGDIKATGDVTVTIPASIAANIKLSGNGSTNTTYNQNDYILNIDKTLISRRSNEPQMQLKIDSGGKVVVQ